MQCDYTFWSEQGKVLRDGISPAARSFTAVDQRTGRQCVTMVNGEDLRDYVIHWMCERLITLGYERVRLRGGEGNDLMSALTAVARLASTHPG